MCSLVSIIQELGSSKSWNHITDQIGMFCYTGIEKEDVRYIFVNGVFGPLSILHIVVLMTEHLCLVVFFEGQ